jgi:hypothetical protein
MVWAVPSDNRAVFAVKSITTFMSNVTFPTMSFALYVADDSATETAYWDLLVVVDELLSEDDESELSDDESDVDEEDEESVLVPLELLHPVKPAMNSSVTRIVIIR